MPKSFATGSVCFTASIILIATSAAHAGTFTGLGGIIKDTLPCVTLSNGNNNCIFLNERINLFQGL
ncbi:hypothetical protein, partial [Chamaesiphon sp. VAR_48_metabat_135_sub]|uniref:hypothetical protein n=1 Tax=Chamaesiphon sp. VAR_48_metabat_135_sub TaxID=2964699 RepID=UPI00286CDAF1